MDEAKMITSLTRSKIDIKNLGKKAPISIFEMLMKEGLQLIDVYPKQSGGQKASLPDPNNTLDKVGYPVSYAEMANNWLV